MKCTYLYAIDFPLSFSLVMVLTSWFHCTHLPYHPIYLSSLFRISYVHVSPSQCFLCITPPCCRLRYLAFWSYFNFYLPYVFFMIVNDAPNTTCGYLSLDLVVSVYYLYLYLCFCFHLSPNPLPSFLSYLTICPYSIIYLGLVLK